MPYRRKYVPRRKRVVRKNYRKRTNYRRKVQKVYRFKRFADLGTFSVTTTDFITTAFFQLQDVPGYTDFTNLYKQYKITGVKLTIVPNETQSIDSTGGATQLRHFSAYSYDESVTSAGGATLNDMRQLPGCRVRSSLRMHKMYIKNPAYAGVINVAQDATATLRTRPETGWLDTEFADIQHLGIVLGWEGGATQSLGVRLEATYYMSFRGTK